MSWVWQSRLFGRSGYEMFSRALMKEIHRRNREVTYLHLIAERDHHNEFSSEAWYQTALQRPISLGSTHVLFHTPAGHSGSNFAREARSMNPGQGRYVCYTMFETDRIPATWVKALESVDEVWVPTQFNFETFSLSGVPKEKIRVLPLGIDAKLLEVGQEVERASHNQPFRFLSTFEWTWRKGWDVLLRAYFEEFRSHENVELGLLAYRGGGANIHDKRSVRERIESFLREELKIDPARAPRLTLFEERVPDQDYAAFCKSFDAFVLPTRGEGWGLPLHESMAMGIPVITTNWGGQLEFLKQGLFFPIELEGLQLAGPEQIRDNVLFAGQRWAEPSVTSTRAAMRRVFENPAEAKRIGKDGQEYVLENFSIEKSADQILKRIEEISPSSCTWALPGVDSTKLEKPLRFLWAGDDSKEDGLSVLLPCFIAVFGKEDRVSLSIASFQGDNGADIQGWVSAYQKITPDLSIKNEGSMKDLEDFRALLNESDVFVFPAHGRDRRGLCREAARLGKAVIATEEILPAELRQESRAFPLASWMTRKNGKTGPELIFKPLPNVLGAVLRWAANHPNSIEALGQVARKVKFADLSQTKSVSLYTQQKPESLPSRILLRELPAFSHTEDFSAMLNRAFLHHPGEEILGVVIGRVPANVLESSLAELERDHSASANFYCLDSQNAVLWLRKLESLRYASFEANFSGIDGLREFVRSMISKGATVLSSNTASLENATDPISRFTKAESLARNGLNEQAVEELYAVLKIKPNYPAAMALLVELLLESRDSFNANEIERLLRFHLQIRPTDSRCRHLWGIYLFTQLRFKEASEHLSFAARVDSENSQIWNDLGVVQGCDGQVKEALESLQKACSLDEKNLDALRNRVDLLSSLGRNQEASGYLRQAVLANPQENDLKERLTRLELAGATHP